MDPFTIGLGIVALGGLLFGASGCESTGGGGYRSDTDDRDAGNTPDAGTWNDLNKPDAGSTDQDTYVPPVNNDQDGDGFPVCAADATAALRKLTKCDCDDNPATGKFIFFGQLDNVGDGVDNNCDGVDGVDEDGDKHATLASGGDDCDDSRDYVYPGATPRIGIDANCSGGKEVDVAKTMAFVGEDGAVNQWAGDQAGTGAIAVGDFNGDGFSDIAIGASGHSTEKVWPKGTEGKIYIYFGAHDRSKVDQESKFKKLELKNELKNADVTIIGGGNWDLGLSLAAIDLDGDKKNDLLITTPGYNNGQCGGTCGDGTGQGLVDGILIMYGRDNWQKSYSFYDINAYDPTVLNNNNMAMLSWPIGTAIGDTINTIDKTMKGNNKGIVIAYVNDARVDILPAKKYAGISDINNNIETKLFDPTFAGSVGIIGSYAVADLNDDGYADALLANHDDYQHNIKGVIRFIFGAPNLPAEINIKNLNNMPGMKYFTMTGNAEGSGAGALVGMVDLDGDGKCEILSLSNGEVSGAGRLYAIYGDQILSAMDGTHPTVNLPNGGNIVLGDNVYNLGGKSITGDFANFPFAMGGLSTSKAGVPGFNKLLIGSSYYPNGGAAQFIDMKALKNKPKDEKDFKANEIATQIIKGGTSLGSTVVGNFDFNGDGVQDALINDGGAENGKGVTYLILGGSTQN